MQRLPSIHSNPGPQLQPDTQAASQSQRPSVREQCEARLNSLQGPDVAAYLQDSRSADSGSRMMAAVERFQNSDAFREFKGELLSHLKNLHRETSEQSGSKFEGSEWERFAGRLKLVPLFEGDVDFGVELYQLYYQSCVLLNRMSLMLSLADEFKANFPQGIKSELVHHLRQLLPTLSVCGPGVMQNISETYASMKYRLLPPDLHALFKDTRVQIARNHFQQIVRQAYRNDPLLASNEIHMVAAFQNSLAVELDLPPIDDRYAARQYVDDSGMTRIQLGMRIMPALAPENVCIQIAAQSLERLKDYMAEDGPLPANSQLFNDCLMKNLERIKPMIGDVSLHLVCDMDDSMLPFRVTRNPTLLALDLLRRLPASARPHYFERSFPISESLTNKVVLKMATSMVWMEETMGKNTEKQHTENRLLSLKDLTQENMEKIMKVTEGPAHRLQLIAYEALRNSDLPDMLYFREVAADPRGSDLNDAALVAAFATLPADIQPGGWQILLQHLESQLKPGASAKLLLSAEASVLSPAQISFLVEKTDPRGTVVSGVEDVNFVQFALFLYHRPDLDLYRASPLLFKTVLERTLFSETMSQRLPLAWAMATDPGYLQAARDIPRLKNRLSAENLLHGLIAEHNKGNPNALAAIHRMIDEIAGHSITPADHQKLIQQMAGCTLADRETAEVITALLDRNTTPEPEPLTAGELANSALGRALATGKPETARLLLTRYSTPIHPVLHRQVWSLFGQMLQHKTESEEDIQVVHALINKGVRVNMPEQHTTALIELCCYGNREVDIVLLKAGCALGARNQAGKNALFIAIEGMAPMQRIISLLNAGVPIDGEGDHYPAIELALSQNNTNLASLLFMHIGNLNQLDSQGLGPLHRAILQASLASDPQEKAIGLLRIEALLIAGCDPNLRTGERPMPRIPLQLAYMHLPEAGRLLFKYRADPNLLDAAQGQP